MQQEAGTAGLTGRGKGPGLTGAQQNYLRIIYEEAKESGYARGCTIAAEAGVTHATVTSTMRALRSMGLIEYERYTPIRLTEKGRAIGVVLSARGCELGRFAGRILGIDGKETQRLLNGMERLLDRNEMDILCRFVSYVLADDKFLRDWDETRETLS